MQYSEVFKFDKGRIVPLFQASLNSNNNIYISYTDSFCYKTLATSTKINLEQF